MGRDRGDEAGQPARRRLPCHRDVHPPPAEARRRKYGIIEDYGGHGIGTEMHMDPHLLNYVERRRGKGPKLVPGFCLAIEPMVSLGTPKTEVLADDWTVITTDGTGPRTGSTRSR